VSQDFIQVCMSGSAAARRASMPSGYFKPSQQWIDLENPTQILTYDGFVFRLPNGTAVS
jgi:hypothetical protein